MGLRPEVITLPTLYSDSIDMDLLRVFESRICLDSEKMSIKLQATSMNVSRVVGTVSAEVEEPPLTEHEEERVMSTRRK